MHNKTWTWGRGRLLWERRTRSMPFCSIGLQRMVLLIYQIIFSPSEFSKSLLIILFPLTSWRSQGLWSSHPSLVGQFPEPEGGFFSFDFLLVSWRRGAAFLCNTSNISSPPPRALKNSQYDKIWKFVYLNTPVTPFPSRLLHSTYPHSQSKLTWGLARSRWWRSWWWSPWPQSPRRAGRLFPSPVCNLQPPVQLVSGLIESCIFRLMLHLWQTYHGKVDITSLYPFSEPGHLHPFYNLYNMYWNEKYKMICKLLLIHLLKRLWVVKTEHQ